MAFDDQLVLKAFTCFWTINDFSKCKTDENLLLKSQIFKTSEHLNSKWHLEIDQQDKKSLGINIVFGGGPQNVLLNFSIYLRANHQWIAVAKKFYYNFNNSTRSRFSVQNAVELEKINSQQRVYLPNKSLTISVVMFKPVIKSSQCFLISRMINEKDLIHTSIQEYKFMKPSDFMTFNDPTPTKIVQRVTKIMDSQTAENYNFEDFDDLIRFFKETKFQLVTLRSPDKVFAVHKALLCARSPIFSDIFKTDSDKNNTLVVDIDDIDSETLESLLQFLHLEPLKTDLKFKEILKFCHASKKYGIKQLAEKCAVLLKEKLSVENICEAFVFADLHGDENLKQYAMQYFCENSKVILCSMEWRDFMLEKTHLVPEILCMLAEKL